MAVNVTDILNNPLSIQHAIISDYENKVDGEVSVVDANNPFAFLIETFASITADATVAMDTKLAGLYPIRANTTKELYNHLSDYDYVGFYSYPASLKLSVMLHRDYLVNNAIAVPDTNYQLVVIPVDTIFTIGRFKFGLYYPIHIKVNTLIDTISASYDTTEDNPLKTLDTNNIEVRANTYEGIDLVAMEFEVYQFNKTVYTESLNTSIGFIKKYTFDDRFFALRVFDVTDGNKTELAYTMSDAVYDVDIVTVNMKVYPDTNELSLSIPYIYFTTGKVGSKIQVELYTTIGELDVSLSNLQIEDISANFAMSSPNTDLTYTNILKNIPTIIITPLSTRIVGGSNNYTFTEMKNYTVYHNNALSVPITRMDLDRFFEKNGFIYMAKIDNLTDRRYYAYKKLYLEEQELGVTCGGLTVQYNEDVVNSGVIYQTNGTIVILPTVIYKYLPTIGKFEIVDDATTTSIKNATGSQLVSMLNDNNYFNNPHHIVFTTLDRYPTCELYDLLTTETTNITFLEENVYLSAQLSLTSVIVRHINNGSGGYTIRIGVERSEDLVDAAISDLNCFLTVMTKDGFRVGIRGVYVGTYDSLDVFDFILSTNYKVSGTRITVTNLTALNLAPAEYEIELSGTMHVATFVKQTLFPSVGQNDTIANYITIDDGSWLGVSLQSFEYKLGVNLSDVIDSNLLTNWTSLQYQTHEVDVPLLYEHDVYETNDQGVLVYSIDGENNIITNKIHLIGEQVYDSEDNPVIKYHVGDTVYDASGSPIPIQSRMKDFTIDLSVFEYSHSVVTTDFLYNLATELASYYNTITEMNTSVLENTDVFFRPIITMNDGRYKVNNTTIVESSLELAFEFNCYVSKATLDDTEMITAIETRIKTIIISHLTDTIFSLTEVAADIKTTLSSYLNSVDAVSLNGDSSVQTLMNIDVDKSPRLGMELAVGKDNRLTYVPKITLNFFALDE